jgi:hypothetical protein
MTAISSPEVIRALSELLFGFVALLELATKRADGPEAFARLQQQPRANFPKSPASRTARPSVQEVAAEPAATSKSPSPVVLVLAAMPPGLLHVARMKVLRR